MHLVDQFCRVVKGVARRLVALLLELQKASGDRLRTASTLLGVAVPLLQHPAVASATCLDSLAALRRLLCDKVRG